MSIETPTGGETVRAVGEAAGPGTRPAPTLTPREQEAAHHARECAGHLRALRAILHARGSLQFDENIFAAEDADEFLQKSIWIDRCSGGGSAGSLRIFAPA